MDDIPRTARDADQSVLESRGGWGPITVALKGSNRKWGCKRFVSGAFSGAHFFGFHSRVSRCASAIWSRVIFSAKFIAHGFRAPPSSAPHHQDENVILRDPVTILVQCAEDGLRAMAPWVCSLPWPPCGTTWRPRSRFAARRDPSGTYSPRTALNAEGHALLLRG